MDERIICVELDDDGHLFAVWTRDDGGVCGYDFDWSKHFGCHIHDMSSFGGDPYIQHAHHRWWAADGVAVRLAHPAGPAPAETRMEALPPDFGNPLGEGIDDRALWCAECNDCFPSDEPCEHCWWDEEEGAYSTPDERAMDPTLSKENPDA